MPPQTQEAPYSPARIMLIVFSLAMGGFGIGTGEFAIMGLMPGVAQDLGVTEPQVGHLISAYALGPWLGGMAISAGLGWQSTGYVGAATAVAGLGIFLLAWRQQAGASSEPEVAFSKES